LGPLGREAVEAQAERAGLPLPRFVGRAAERQLRRERSATLTRDPPDLAKEPYTGGVLEVEVTLEAEAWGGLEQAAARQQVGLEQLLVHACLTLAAELDGEDPAAIIADLEARGD
jgi:hypothetical protein